LLFSRGRPFRLVRAEPCLVLAALAIALGVALGYAVQLINAAAVSKG
jgi:hypothetical protein